MPSGESLRIFLSATTRDLGSYRRALAHTLRTAGCHVEVQENFAAHGGKFLAKLRDYILSCDLVVCLVGEHFGWEPAPAASITSTARDTYPELLVSATEWEYFLADDAPCDVFVYLTADGFAPDEPSDDTPDKAAAHRRFRAHLETVGEDCNPFRDLPKLTEDVLTALHLRALRRAGGHRPRVLPKAAQFFTGRVPDVDWVKTRLLSETRVALIGPGGIGKTAIAHEAIASLSPEDAKFAHFPGGIFLHDFYAAPGHLAAIESIVAQAGLTDLDDAEREPRARALLAGPRALVYLEGCEKAEDLSRFLDLCGPAAVLITSRLDRDAKGAAAHHVEALPLDEAAELLRRHAADAARDAGTLPGDADAVWREIAALLGRHALAVRLAGFRLGSGNETPAEFRELLKSEGFEHFDDDTRGKESLNLLFTHCAQVLSPDARAAWYALALHALAPIHLAAIATALGVEEKAARKALEELVRHSLADAARMPAETEGATEPAWHLAHALLPEWGRKKLADSGVEAGAVFARWKAGWFAFLKGCFHAGRVPGGPARHGALTEHFDALIEGIAAQDGAESHALGAALTNIGNVHRSMGRYTAAEICLQRALAISEKIHGPEHRDTLASLNNLASFLAGKGDPAGAEPLYRRALEACERTLGPEHPDTLTSLNNLAILLARKGDLVGAEPLHRRALEARERTLGPEHPDTLGSLNNLALLIKQKGDLAGAEPLYRRVLDARVRTLGPEHPNTLVGLMNLSYLLCDRGDFNAAEPLARRAADGFAKVLLPQHLWRQKAAGLLAKIQAARGGGGGPGM